MKTLAFVFGLCIATVGVVGILMPSSLGLLAQPFVTSSAVAFFVLAAVRIAFGLILISVASASRAPAALRVLGFIIVILGVTTALGRLLAGEQVKGAIEWWLRQESIVVRLTAVFVLALGSFIAYACAPAPRAA